MKLTENDCQERKLKRVDPKEESRVRSALYAASQLQL